MAKLRMTLTVYASQLIVENHQVADTELLSLYIGAQAEQAALLRPDQYALTLADMNFPTGSLNDYIVQIVTYTYRPHTTTADASAAGAKHYGISSLPRGLTRSTLRPMGTA